MKIKIRDITFKQFNEWTNNRACDGRWSIVDAMNSCEAIAEYHKYNVFWKRKQKWEEIKEKYFNLDAEIEIND